MEDKEFNVRVELPQIVNNTLEQPSKTLGSKISDLLEIIFGGISYKKDELTLKRQHNFDLFKMKLQEEMDKIPTERKTEPRESIIGPALEAAKYRIEDEEIRDMFAKLLASSTDSEKEEKIHPCFIEILKNLSPNDALAFKKISDIRNSHLTPVVSLAETVLLVPNNGRHYSWLASDFGFKQSNKILHSLLRNGLIEISTALPKEIKVLGFSFEKLEKLFIEEVPYAKDNYYFEHGFITISPLGLDFALVCSPEEINMQLFKALHKVLDEKNLDLAELMHIFNENK